MTVCHYQIKRAKRVEIIELNTRYQIKRMRNLLKNMNPDSYIWTYRDTDVADEEPHNHWHEHAPLIRAHPNMLDMHYRHVH
jgi:hypothetical protein